MHANEEKYIDKIFKERSKLKAKTSEQKPKTDDDMAKIIQRHWRGHSQRRFQAIGRKKKFEVGKGITLWRTFRFITIHKYDKMLG